MTLPLPVLAAAAVFAGVYLLAQRRPGAGLARRLAPYAGAGRHETPERTLRSAASERRLRRLPGWRRLEVLLDRADIAVPVPKLAGIAVAGGALVALLALALGAAPVAVACLLALAVLALRVWAGIRISRRRRAFDDQLPELLRELGNAMRAGHSFDQALQAVAADAEPPAGKELTRVLAETRLGRPLEDALADLGRRIASRDLDFVLDAIVVQRQVGGSLAGIFELVGETVAQRHQFTLRLRSLTALGRISALVLLALPVVLALGLTAIDHSYLSPLFASSSGRLALPACAVAMTVGALWLRQIASVGTGRR